MIPGFINTIDLLTEGVQKGEIGLGAALIIGVIFIALFLGIALGLPWLHFRSKNKDH